MDIEPVQPTVEEFFMKDNLYLRGHEALVNCLALIHQPENNYLLSSDNGSNLFVWDLQTYTKLKNFRISGQTINSLLVTKDDHGFSLILVGSQCFITVFDFTSFSKLEVLDHDRPKEDKNDPEIFIIALAITRNKKHLVSASKVKIVIWKFSTLSKVFETKEPLTSHVSAVAVSPDDKNFLIGFENSKIRFWNIKKQQFEAEVDALSQSINSLKISPDSQYLISLSYDQQFLLGWSLSDIAKTPKLIHYPNDTKIIEFAFIKNGSQLMLVFENQVIHYLNTEKMHVEQEQLDVELGKLETFEPGLKVSSFLLSPDEKKAYVGLTNGVVYEEDLIKQSCQEMKCHIDYIYKIVDKPELNLAISASNARVKFWRRNDKSIAYDLPSDQLNLYMLDDIIPFGDDIIAKCKNIHSIIYLALDLREEIIPNILYFHNTI